MDGFKKDMEHKSRQIDWIKRDRMRLGVLGVDKNMQRISEESIAGYIGVAAAGVAVGGLIGYLLGSQ